MRGHVGRVFLACADKPGLPADDVFVIDDALCSVPLSGSGAGTLDDDTSSALSCCAVTLWLLDTDRDVPDTSLDPDDLSCVA